MIDELYGMLELPTLRVLRTPPMVVGILVKYVIVRCAIQANVRCRLVHQKRIGRAAAEHEQERQHVG